MSCTLIVPESLMSAAGAERSSRRGSRRCPAPKRRRAGCSCAAAGDRVSGKVARSAGALVRAGGDSTILGGDDRADRCRAARAREDNALDVLAHGAASVEIADAVGRERDGAGEVEVAAPAEQNGAGDLFAHGGAALEVTDAVGERGDAARAVGSAAAPKRMVHWKSSHTVSSPL